MTIMMVMMMILMMLCVLEYTWNISAERRRL